MALKLTEDLSRAEAARQGDFHQIGNLLRKIVTLLGDVTDGVIEAGKAIVADANKSISGLVGLVFGAGGFITVDNGSAACTGTGGTSTATLNKMAGVLTTAAITTAAAASHVITLTNSLIGGANDLIFVTRQNGGTNTRQNYNIAAVCTGASTATITITNTEPSNALNGTVGFAFTLQKAAN